MLLGLAKGKVGDLVFYRDGGEQRTRTRVVPKNPRTTAQMEQRVKIANAAGLYRAAAAILKDSFTNRPSNQSGYNSFASGAIVNAPYLTKQQASAGVCLPQPVMLSRGVLPSLDYVELASETYRGIGIAADFSTSRPTTLGGFAEGLIAAYPYMQEGDELNFVELRFKPIEGVDAEVDLYAVSMDNTSYVLNTADTTPIGGAKVAWDAGAFYATQQSTNEEGDIYMLAIIHSRVDGSGKLQVSTQWTYLSEAAQSLYDGYRNEEALADAIESYKVSATPILR